MPAESLIYLLPSRYCESDLLSNEAWRLFGHLAPGWSRVQAVCDFVHAHVIFGYEFSHRDRTATDAYRERARRLPRFRPSRRRLLPGPQRPDALLHRLHQLHRQPEPHAAGDFAAWMEVFLGGRWHVFDPRNNKPRIGRVMMAFGRDAADVPLTHTFGPNSLVGFRVWADAVETLAAIEEAPDALPGEVQLPQIIRPARPERAARRDRRRLRRRRRPARSRA